MLNTFQLQFLAQSLPNLIVVFMVTQLLQVNTEEYLKNRPLPSTFINMQTFSLVILYKRYLWESCSIKRTKCSLEKVRKMWKVWAELALDRIYYWMFIMVVMKLRVPLKLETFWSAEYHHLLRKTLYCGVGPSYIAPRGCKIVGI
jgi:hypothetical protein